MYALIVVYACVCARVCEAQHVSREGKIEPTSTPD